MATLEFTRDKYQLVSNILKLKDLYQILHVSRQATRDDITKQYKKLSVLVHPDRNPHPKATDAFKKLGEAKSVLTDERLRETYNLTGSMSRQHAGPFTPHWSQGSPRYGGAYKYDDILSALFSSTHHPHFAFGNAGYTQFNAHPFQFFGNAHQREQTTRHTTSRQPNSWFFQLLPLFVFFLYFMWQIQASAVFLPNYKLYKTNTYNIPYQTLQHGITYWTKSDFEHDMFLDPDIRQSFEQDVQEEWQNFKQNECKYERQQMYNRNRVPPACTELKTLLQTA